MRRGLLVAFLVVGGCTLLTQFDPDGQPCDEGAFDPAEACLSDAGYWCVNGLCRKTGGPPDSGQPPFDSGTPMDSGVDSGTHNSGVGNAGTNDGGNRDGGDGG